MTAKAKSSGNIGIYGNSNTAILSDKHDIIATKDFVQEWLDNFVEQPPEVLSVTQYSGTVSIRFRLVGSLTHIPLKTPFGDPLEIFARNDGTFYVNLQQR